MHRGQEITGRLFVARGGPAEFEPVEEPLYEIVLMVIFANGGDGCS